MLVSLLFTVGAILSIYFWPFIVANAVVKYKLFAILFPSILWLCSIVGPMILHYEHNERVKKKKAMEEIVLFEEIIDENKNRNTSHHHQHHHHKSKKNKFSYSKSEKKIYKMESHKSLKKKNYSNKVLKGNTGMHIIINYANDSNIKSKNNNSNVNKKKIKPLSSIASNFSKIKMNESFLNKNDSVIHSIVDEMAVVKI